MARPGQPVAFVGRDDEDGARAAQLAAAVGVRDIAGFLQGGMTAWEQQELPVEHVERVPARALPARLEAEPDLQILDVRERREWEAEHLRGSICVPWHDLVDAPEGIAPDRPVAVLCATGPRAATAAALLKRHGYRDVIHVAEGGVATLSRDGLQLERGAPAPA